VVKDIHIPYPLYLSVPERENLAALLDYHGTCVVAAAGAAMAAC